jgi:magnesium chelatase subunit I
MQLPRWIREVVEGVAFAARQDKKVDKRSGVSQRLPITALENAVSNAERRTLRHHERPIVPRVSDVYAALPSLTGKLELEYEGELVGAEKLGRDLIRASVAEVFGIHLGAADLKGVVEWFEEGGSLKLDEDAPSTELLSELEKVPGLMGHVGALGVAPDAPPSLMAAAAEFVLEGLYAQKRIGRSDEQGFVAVERRAEVEIDLEQLERLRRLKRQVN